MPTTQKGYKLKITLLETASGYENIREVELSFVTAVAELHHIIQSLYGLEDCHLRMLSNKEIDATWEVYPPIEGQNAEVMNMYSNTDEVCNANSVLLGQFISRKYKTVYYTYDFGTMTQRKIEYQGLTTVPMGKHICRYAMGYYLLEDLPVREQNELMDICRRKDKQKLKKDYDRFENWKDFQQYITPAFRAIDTEDLNVLINEVGHLKHI